MTHPIIPPFPPHINRDHFGHWLSGFVDGEGCFFLGICSSNTPTARFVTYLRDDDKQILCLIQSFFGCGYLTRNSRTGGGRKSQIGFTISAASELVSLVIPHFHRYPLRAKKARDFELWEMGVNLIDWVLTSPKIPRWTEKILAEYLRIQSLLRTGREYSPA